MGLLGSLLALTGCGSAVEWNRKITVIVNTPRGEVTGYAVQREGIAEKGGWWAPMEATGAARHLAGEAVVVDMGEGKFLFALIQENRPDTFQVLRPDEAPLKIAADMATMRGPHRLSSKDYPLLVMFTDINEPRSVREVKPAKLAESFGPGYALRSITLEITDEAVPKMQISNTLVWLDDELALTRFWQALLASGYQPNGSTEVKRLFQAGEF